FQSKIGEQTAYNARRTSENYAFDQKLADQSSATCTQSNPKRNLSFADGRSGEQQVADVRAGNQEQKENCGEQSVECFAEVTDDKVQQRASYDSELLRIQFA